MRSKISALTTLILISTILLTGCGSVPPMNPPTGTATILPSTTPTNLPQPAETITPEHQSALVEQNCVDVLPAMPANFTAVGIIPLENFQTRNVAFLNLATGDESQIPNIEEWIADYAVSPDRRTLAYKTYGTSRISLTLTDALNSHTQTIFSEQADYGLYYWLNNEELLLGKNDQWVIFNPYTMEEKSYTVDDFPDFNTDNFRNNFVVFDSTASRVVYKNGYIFLLNMDSKEVVVQIPDEYDRAPLAVWTLDGHEAAIVGATQLGRYLGQSGDDIFGVTRDGLVTQLTRLTENYGMGFIIYSLSWSPDSHYIAFWMRFPKTSEWQLAVLDVLTQKVTNYCITTDPYASSGGVPLDVSAPIWSPDNQQIIVEHRTSDSNYVVLLDIAQNTAFQIAPNAVPLGWMVAP